MDLTEIRKEFARAICARAGLDAGSGIERAFATTPREEFLGQPPWRVNLGQESFETSDPAELYRDSVVALRRDRGINNGQPSLHAACFRALRLREGDSVVHVGAGAGYYTALLAKLVGGQGRVDAYEVDTGLAAEATCNLRALPQVRMHAVSGSEGLLPSCDALYVSAGANSPVSAWLDALRAGGRLLFPLTTENGTGAMLLVTRRGEDTGIFAAHFVIEVAFIPCVGARDAETAARLKEAFRRGGTKEVRSLHRVYRDDRPDESAWCWGKNWWLSKREEDQRGA